MLRHSVFCSNLRHCCHIQSFRRTTLDCRRSTSVRWDRQACLIRHSDSPTATMVESWAQSIPLSYKDNKLYSSGSGKFLWKAISGLLDSLRLPLLLLLRKVFFFLLTLLSLFVHFSIWSCIWHHHKYQDILLKSEYIPFPFSLSSCSNRARSLSSLRICLST